MSWGHWIARLAESVRGSSKFSRRGRPRRRGAAVRGRRARALFAVESLEERTLLSSTPAQTALDAYVHAPDPSYQYALNSTLTGTGYTDYVLNLTSQTWRTSADVNQPVWQHWLQVIVPSAVTSHTAILQITGGSTTSTPPTSADGTGVLTALSTGAITVVLPDVPNEPLTFTDETTPRTEDQIIAYTYNKFLNGGDQNWPLLLPMVNSAVKAMDATQSFVASQSGGTFQVNDFIVSGASKRGWTTWLTPAVDNRVRAIVPFVFDISNFSQNIPHLKDTYVGVTQNVDGGFPIAVQDYTNFNIFGRFGTPRGVELAQIVDPFSYFGRSGYDIPKYMVYSAGDQFFVPDSSQHYFGDLPGQNYIRYVPNTGHGLNFDALQGAINFEKALLDGAALPRFSWSVADAGTTIDVHTIDAPVTVKLWQATDPNSRDFRIDSIGAAYTNSTLTDQGGGFYVAHVDAPATGATAFLVELTYQVDGVTLTFTTQVDTVPLFTPTVAATDGGGTFNTEPFPATATATGLSGFPVDGNFAFTYYAGTTASGTGTSTPPTAAGTYTVVASFTSADPAYVDGQSAPVTFTIAPASIVLHNGVLTLTGDTSDNAFTVDLFDSGAVDVTVDGVQQHFDPGAVQSISVDGGGGTDSLTVNDVNTASGQTYTLTGTTLDRSNAPPITYADIENIVLNAGNHGNSVDWQGTAAGSVTRVNSGAGDDTINFGDANNTLDGFLGTPIIDGQGGTNADYVHDEGSTSPHTYVLTSDSLSRDGGTGYGSNIQSVNYFFGSGGNTIDWQGTGAGSVTRVHAGAGDDTLNVGDANNTLDGFQGEPIFDGQGGTNTATINDQGSTAAHDYVLTGGSIGRDGGTGFYSNVRTLTFNGGSGGNTIDWQGTSADTTVNTGAGGNTVNVGDANHTLDGFLGTPVLVGQGAGNTLNVHDDGSSAPHTYVITGSTISRDGGTGYYSGVQALNFFGGRGGNTINWQGTAAGSTDTVFAGAGNDTINFGDANNTLDGFLGTPVLYGQGGTNTANINDQGSAVAHNYVLTATSLSRDGGTGYGYNLQRVTINGSKAGSNYAVQSIASGSKVTIHGGPGQDTLTGPDAGNNWKITGTNAGTLDGRLSFTGIEYLTGGSGYDTFAFANGAKVTGSIDGGGGSNTLDYSAYKTNLIVDLALGSATGVGGTVSNIGNVLGGSGNDILVGNGGHNLLSDPGGRNLIIGEGGPDVLVGGIGGNILIGGTTIYDKNLTALQAILNEWARTDKSYQQRISDLRFGTGLNGNVVLDTTPVPGVTSVPTVVDNGAGDILIGGAGQDWFFADPAHALLLNRRPSERVN